MPYKYKFAGDFVWQRIVPQCFLLTVSAFHVDACNLLP